MSALLGLALDLGVPALVNVLRKSTGRAGNLVADVAEGAIRRISKDLGVEASEEAIVAKYNDDPDLAVKVIRDVDGQLAAVAEAASEATQSYHQVLAADVQSTGLLNRIWRPLNGILFAIASLALVLSFCRLMWLGDTGTIANASVAYGFLGTVLGTWAGVVGVYVWRRTDEKKAGAA